MNILERLKIIYKFTITKDNINQSFFINYITSYSPFEMGCKIAENELELLELLELGGDPNKFGLGYNQTPFLILCQYNKFINIEMIKLIKKYNPLIKLSLRYYNISTNSVAFPLHFLYKNPKFDPEMMNLFIDMNTDPEESFYFPEVYRKCVKNYRKVVYLLKSKILLLEIKKRIINQFPDPDLVKSKIFRIIFGPRNYQVQ